jgi:hypothetical protein
MRAASDSPLLEFICSLLPYLLPLALGLLMLLTAINSLMCLRRLLFEPAREGVVDGIHNNDLALEMTGSSGNIGEIVEEAGHLPLLRNLERDSRVFVPLYVIAFTIAILLLIGMPFACGRFPFQPLAALALLLTGCAALFDWRENACLAKALRLNASADEKVAGERQRLLGQGRDWAVRKFLVLASVAVLLAFHAWRPDAVPGSPSWAGYPLGIAFAGAALGMFASPLRPRYLESAVAIAGFAITLLFFLHAWKGLP